MYTSNKTWCVVLISFLFSKGAFLLNCGIFNFNESLIAEEYSFRNISYTINITGNSFFADYKVCEEDVMKTACNFVKDMNDTDFSSMFGKDLSVKPGVTCYWEQRNLSSSVVALDINISQLVTRSLSAMILSTSTRGLPKPTRLIHVEVLYPPSITSLVVEGREANGYYIINNSQEVNVSCYFEKGNPPAVFRLLVNNGTELRSSHNDGHLHHLLTVQCDDTWPTVRCEGNGTQQNRSVVFLVRSPPQFVDVSTLVYTTSGHIQFPVKAHTTTFTACFLTSMSEEAINKRNVSCTLNGKPPDLNLNIHLDTETQGNWTLTLRNEMGSANATISILGSLTSAASPAPTSGENVTTALVSGFVVTVVIIAVVSIIVVRNMKKQKHEVAVREGTSENLQGYSSTIIVNDLYEASGGADSNNIVNRSPSMPSTLSEVLTRPPRSRLPTENAQSETRNSSFETSENTYVSAPVVREKKRLQKKDRETYVAKATHTATNAAEMKKPSYNRNADGLIYADLVFTNTSLSKVIIETEEKTEYADIKVTFSRPQTECRQKKIEARSDD